MIIIIILSVITLIGAIWWAIEHWITPIGALLMTIFGGSGLLICFISFFATRVEDGQAMRQYYSAKATIEQSRASGKLSEYERASLLKTIIEINAGIANAKYWNEGVFDIFVVDEYANLEPLK